LWQAAQQQQNLVSRDRPLSFITALPCLADNRTESVTAAMPEQQPAPVAGPSHLLKGAIALRLVHDMPLAPGISIVDSTQGWQLHGDAMVNGRAVNDGARLAAGDRISLPDGDVLLIEVRE
jgi:hypothetical protein